MRVLHAATHEHTGAGRAAARIHAAVAAAGVASSMLVLYGDAKPGVEVLGGSLRRRVANLRLGIEETVLSLQTGGESGYRSLGLAGPGRTAIAAHAADVLHLHWIPNLLGVADLPVLSRPLVWTFHDAWPICGAEHYTSSARPREGYSAANRMPGAAGPDLDRWVWERKREHWGTLAPLIVCPSRWLAEQVRASVLFGGREVHVVPNPLDTALFRPQDRVQARANLGLPADRTLIVFGAWGAATDRRKGFHVLSEALATLAQRGCAAKTDLVVFGAEGSERVQGFATHWMGFIEDEAKMSALYAACDVFALPSLQDNYPNTLAEAMACGLAVAASEVGGVPDLVRPMQTGLLAPPGDAPQIAQSLETLLADAALRARMGAAARQAVEAACSPQAVGARYAELYQQAARRSKA